MSFQLCPEPCLFHNTTFYLLDFLHSAFEAQLDFQFHLYWTHIMAWTKSMAKTLSLSPLLIA